MRKFKNDNILTITNKLKNLKMSISNYEVKMFGEVNRLIYQEDYYGKNVEFSPRTIACTSNHFHIYKNKLSFIT